LLTAHKALSAAFYLLHTVVGHGAVNKFGICFQLRNKHIRSRMMLFALGNDTMNAPRYWQQRNVRPAILATARWFCQPNYRHCSAVDNGAMNFLPSLAIVCKKKFKKQGGALNCKGLSQDGGRINFSENLRASLFYDDLPNEPTFSRI
jgi:hypothetical protein